MFFRNNNNTNARGGKQRCRNGNNCSYGLKCNFYHFPNEIEQFKKRENNQRSNRNNSNALGTNGYKFKPHHEKDAKHCNKNNYYQHICIGNNSHQSKSLEELRLEDQFAPSTNNNNNNNLWSWSNNNNNNSKNDNKTSELNVITSNTTNNTSNSWFNDIKTDNNIDSTNNVSNNTSNFDWGWNTNNNSTNNTNTTISNNMSDTNIFSSKPNNNTNTNISNNMSDSNSNIFSWNPDNNTNTNNLTNNISSTGSMETFSWNVDSSSTNNNTNNNSTNNNTNTLNLTSNNNISDTNSNMFSWKPNNNTNTNNFTNNNINSKNEKKDNNINVNNSNIPVWCKDNNNFNTCIVTNQNSNTNNNNFVVSNNNTNSNDGMFLKYNQNPYQIDMSDGLKELNDPSSTLNHLETDWKSYISNTENNMYSSLKHSYIQTNKSNNNKRMNLSVIKLTSRNKSYLQNIKKAPVITIKPRSSMRINPLNTIKNKLSIPIRRYTSELRTIRNLGPVPTIPDLSQYFVNKNKEQLHNISENSDDSSLENDVGINENNIIMKDVVLSSTHRKDRILCPKLTRLGYYTIPSMDILKEMNEKELYMIKDFSVGHNIYGNITWNGISDIRSLDLDKIVFLEYGRVEVYPDHIIDKPKQGQLLNKYAMIRLNNIYPPINENVGLTDQEYEMIKKHYGEKLAKHCDENECQFIKYDTKQGIWEFTVGHFSVYGVPYHDQNDNK